MPVNPDDMIQLLMKTNADQEERLKEKDQMISDLRATVEELRNTVTDLRSTIANLNETLDEFKRKFFGTSSEKVKKERSVDLSAQGTDPEETVTVKEHTRTRKKKSVRDDLYALLPIRDIKCDVPESERFCPDCDAPMEHLGYKTVREELRITPAKVERVRYLQETLVQRIINNCYIKQMPLPLHAFECICGERSTSKVPVHNRVPLVSDMQY